MTVSYAKLYTNAVAVAVGATVAGKVVNYVGTSGGIGTTQNQPCEIPDCVRAFVSYTPGVAGRTLTIALYFAYDPAGSLYVPEEGSTFTITGGAGGTPVLKTFPIGTLGIPAFQLKYTSAGGAGADDAVTVVLANLPPRGVIFT